MSPLVPWYLTLATLATPSGQPQLQQAHCWTAPPRSACSTPPLPPYGPCKGALHARGDAFVTRCSRASLRLLGSVGELINPEAWRWYHDMVGEGRCPIVDTWWQTETGDGCKQDADGYYWVTGRVEDVINLSGHRIGTSEVKSALQAHPGCVEAAVVPVEHPIRGQALYAFVTLMEGLSAPGMCASQLLALNTTALLNTSLTAQELMPGLGYFAMDVAQLLRDYLNDSSIVVQVADFCAGNRTVAPFIDNKTLVNGPWPTLNVTISFITTEPERLSSPTSPLRRLPMNCRGSLTARDSLGFFTRYGMPFHRCQVSLLPNSPPPSPSPPQPSPPPSPSPPAPPPTSQPQPQPPPSQPVSPAPTSAPPLSTAAARQLPAADPPGG
ncbi:hypothetical protein V8C86DRAFT_3148820 [Haematococcus lacustris]